MSYLVLARKWRPQRFEDIVGQSHVTTTLSNAIRTGRVAHAYLFTGSRGVGKTTTARILAKALNCEQGPTVTPCNKCSSCLEITASNSMDVLEIDGASNRGIDEIRTLRENVKFAPASGTYKVYIIDEVHQITNDGFNALLKTLEEPPAFVKFIFATTQPNKVPPTILSRCQRLDFRRISVMEIIKQLERIIAAEKAAVAQDVLVAIARASDGSLRDAESILDQLVAFAKGPVTRADVVSMLGMVEQEVLFEVSSAIIRKDAVGALTVVDRVISLGKDPGIFLSELTEHFRNLMVAKVCRDNSRLIDLPQEICVKLVEHADSLSMEEILNGFNVLLNAQELSKRLESVRIPLEIGMIRLCRNPKQESAPAPRSPASAGLKPPQQAQEARQQGHRPQTQNDHKQPSVRGRNSHSGKDEPAAGQEKSGLSAPERAPEGPVPPVNSAQISDEPAPAIHAAQPAISLDTVKDSWQAIVSNISKVKISIATYLKEGAPARVSGGVLTVAFHKNHALHKETLERKENREMVEKFVGEAVQAAVRVLFVLLDTEKEEDATSSHPIVQSALDMFNARLVEG